MLELRPVRFDHPDSRRLIRAVQHVYRVRYGDEDGTSIDPREFDTPEGYFVVGYVDGTPVACGGWRARDGADNPLRAGDAEVKRMYVAPSHRGRGFARALLAELERTAAAAGRRRAVLETGTRQPEAITLYLSAGYAAMPRFGAYRDEPDSRCYAKALVGAVDANRRASTSSVRVADQPAAIPAGDSATDGAAGHDPRSWQSAGSVSRTCCAKVHW